MTEVNRRMPNNGDDDLRAKCREYRRRRIEMRRLAVSTAASSSSPPTSQSPQGASPGGIQAAGDKRTRVADSADFPATLSMSGDGGASSPSEASSKATAGDPVFGTMSVSGRSRDMEDAIAVRTSLCVPDINLHQPVHFFGVYDGHGGIHVAALCRERMHVLLEEELMRVESTPGRESGGERELEAKWRRVMKRCFERMDDVALNTCACGGVGFQCGCHPMEFALAGSTAVVAVLTPEYLIVGNCGDSRAVLCRGGTAVPLSIDQKPDRPDELARIEAAGGRVISLNGARVEGILAMSRAIGDRYLKPVVISEPEVTFIKREPEDECLILATDGLWDVLSSQLACEVARECLLEVNPPQAQVEDEGGGALYPSRSTLAAALLTRLALGRRSSDNISVIVVDLKKS